MKLWSILKKIRYDLALVLLAFFFCWLFAGRLGPFAAKVDWFSQHSVFPDYFRRLFYETGDFFPEFAANIGGGQNIYYFSYYGLYSPVILLSYLLPFVPMSRYIMVVSALGLAASAALFYRWLLTRGFSDGISFGCALAFLLSGPMIYQSCKHIMFVNYMPFLCMGFFGVDRHLEKRRSGLLAVSVWLMILTSFYFSIGGMLALTLYGIYAWLRQQEKNGQRVRAGLFFKDGLYFAAPFVTAVLLAGLLLVPTALVLASRGESGEQAALWQLLLPKLPITRMVHGAYGIGQTTLLVTVLLTGLTYPKVREKILHASILALLSVPFFTCLLNGGLYERDKVWIPFLPLCLFLLAMYVDRWQKKEFSFWQAVVPYAVTLALLFLCREQFATGAIPEGLARRHWELFLGEGLLFFAIGLINRKYCRPALFLLPSVVLLFAFESHTMKTNITLLEPEFYRQVTDRRWEAQIAELAEGEDGFYRIEQGGDARWKEADINRIWSMGQYVSSVYSSAFSERYREFRRKTFQVEEIFRNDLMQNASENPIFRQFMGVKYRLSLTDEGQIQVRVNEQAAPVIYATDRLLPSDAYERLSFPLNQMALQSYAVVEQEEKTALDWKEKLSGRLTELPLRLTGTEHAILLPDAEKETGDRILFVQFDVENKRPDKDVTVWIGGVRNKLTAESSFYSNGNTTFCYGLSCPQGKKKMSVKWSEGEYALSDCRAWLAAEPEEEPLYQSVFLPDKKKTKGDRIVGTIDVKKPGMLVTSMPYDDGFTIRIDGKKVEKQLVNTAFLGARITEGAHELTIVYHAPGAAAGRWSSLMGLLGLAALLGAERTKGD